MADPVIVKVSDLTELTDLASGDLLTVVDISESVVSAKTKKLQAQSVKIFNANQLGANVVSQAAIANLAISSDKLATGAVTAGKIAAGGVSASNQFAAQVVDTATIADATVTLAKLAANASVAIRNLIYIQLFPAGDLIVSASPKAYFFVPSHLTGMKIKKVGMGVVTAASPAANTTVALSTYASIAGNGFVEGADINVSLPQAGTKIPINVTAGTGSPKGLDFWFVVGY
jgi:hypothetical protein